MRNYLRAEWGKAVSRRYFRSFLLVLAGGGVVLALLWRWSIRQGFQVTYGECLALLTPFLTIGLYLAWVVADLVFSDQYKHDTLKNEISYGLPRSRIYLGKAVTAAGVGLLLTFLSLAVYAAACRLLLPAGPGDAAAGEFLFRLLSALPLWLGALSLGMAVLFNVSHMVIIIVCALASVGVLGSVLRLAMRVGPEWLSEGARAVYRLLLTTPLDSASVPAWDWGYLGWCVGVGALWTVGATLLGLALFRRREIR